MISLLPLQTLEHVAIKSEMIAKSDPHGWKVAVVSLAVILTSLFILYLCYMIIGKIVEKIESKSSKLSEQDVTDDQTEEQLHDRESYKITLSGKPKTTISSDYGQIAKITLSESPANGGHQTEQKKSVNGRGTILSPLPGILTNINVKVGDKVSAGQTVAQLEAMTMENSIEAETNGTVTEIYVSKGDSVLEGTAILKIQ